MLFNAYQYDHAQSDRPEPTVATVALLVNIGGTDTAVAVPESATVESLKEILFAGKHTDLLPAAQKVVVRGAVAANDLTMATLGATATSNGTTSGTIGQPKATKLMLLRDHSYLPAEVEVRVWLPEKPWARLSISPTGTMQQLKEILQRHHGLSCNHASYALFDRVRRHV
jgi:hypothetical protein